MCGWTELPDAAAREEILETNNRIYEVTGSYPVYAPASRCSEKRNRILGGNDSVFWTIDTWTGKHKIQKM